MAVGGAFDTLMINMGSGTQGPLRELVQMLTGAVDIAGDVGDVFGAIPGPVLAGAASLAAVAALKGPVGGALDTISLKAMYAAESLAGGAGLRGAAGGLVSFLGGPWGLAIGGAITGTMVLADYLGRATEATDDTKNAQKSLAQALEDSNGAINENVRLTAAKAAQDADLFDMAGELGLSLQTITNAVLGEKDAYDQVTVALQRYRDTVMIESGGESDQFGRAIEDTNRYRNQLDELAPTVAISRREQQELAAATGQAGGAAAEATSPVDALTAALEANKTTADAASKAVDQLIAAALTARDDVVSSSCPWTS